MAFLVPLNGEAVAPLLSPQQALLPLPAHQAPSPTPMKALIRLSAAIPALIRGGPSGRRVLPAFQLAAPGRLTLALFGWDGRKRVRIGGGELRFGASATKQMRIRLNKKGRALLGRPKRTQILAITTFRPDGGVAFRHMAKYRIKAPKPTRR